MILMGTLYVVGTPIGNLEDITLRALRVLREVDVIACEDTRHARTLLQRHGVTTPLVSYHEHNERERAPQLVRRLLAGEGVALITAAGGPAISDPRVHPITQALAPGGAPMRSRRRSPECDCGARSPWSWRARRPRSRPHVRTNRRPTCGASSTAGCRAATPPAVSRRPTASPTGRPIRWPWSYPGSEGLAAP